MRATRLSRTSPRLAGVSLGTVSNVLNRPDRVNADTARRVQRRDGRARLRAQRVGPPARAGTQPARSAYVMLDVANPFFTDVAAGIEDGGRDRRTCRWCSATAATARRARGRSPRPARAAAGPGRPGHARSTRTRRCSTRSRRAARRVVVVDRTRRRPLLLLGLRRRRPRRPARGRAPPRPRPPPGRLRRRAVHLGQVRDRLQGARTPGRRPACPPRTWSSLETDVARPSRAAARPGSGWPGCRPGVARPRRSAPTTCSRSGLLQHAISTGAPGAGGARHRRVRRHRVRRGGRRTPHVGAPAPPRARAHRRRAGPGRGEQPRARAPAGAVHPGAGRARVDAGLTIAGADAEHRVSRLPRRCGRRQSRAL